MVQIETETLLDKSRTACDKPGYTHGEKSCRVRPSIPEGLPSDVGEQALSGRIERAAHTSTFGLVDLAMLGVALFWGVNFAFVKFTLGEMLPLTFNGLRFVLASGVMVLLTRLLDGSLRVERSDWGRILFTGLIGNTLYQILFIQGLQRTTAGNSSVLVSTHPIFVALISALLGLERVTNRMWLGIVLSFGGILLVIAKGANGLSFGGETLLGDALTILAGLSWAVYVILARPLVSKYSPMRVATLTMVAGTPALLLAAIPDLLAQDWAGISLRAWGGLGYSFLFSISIAYFLYYQAMRAIGNTKTGIYVNLVPISALVTATLTLNEPIHALQILGAAIIIIGVYLARAGNGR